MRRGGFAAIALAAALSAAAADDMKRPRIALATVDWDELAAELTALQELAPNFASADNELRAAVSARVAQLARLNRTMEERFPGIAASPAPVLLPFNTAADLRERALSGNAAPAGQPAPITKHLSGFQGVPFFYAGPGGYDAVVVGHAQTMPELRIRYRKPIHVHISGSALVYEIDKPVGMIGWPITSGLEADFPGIKRLFLDNYVRYTFVRYGMPYTVAIECFDGASRFGKISCREADKVAVRALRALRFVGGTPAAIPAAETVQGLKTASAVEPNTIERPEVLSSDFTYHSPGDLLPGTGFKRRTGVADYTVYSKIRFPLAEGPAFANSQSFMNWGNCEATGRVRLGMRGRTSAYRCKVNNQPLINDESAPANYSYPWRDNFCEHRFFFVGQCPGGLGHQGQDIRPASCKQRIKGANRCEPYLHEVVAARDGAVLRSPGAEALFIVVNAPHERLRFRYLHMQPKQFDAAGMVSGRLVREGEVIGKVGNYFKKERATTYHLHFDLQVPTQYGWAFVNPYVTLVAAYERLIGGRGREFKPAAEAPPTAAKPTETELDSPPAQQDETGNQHDERAERATSVTASLPAAARGSDSIDLRPPDAGRGKQVRIRSMARRIPRQGDRAWDFRRYLFPGYGRR